MAIGEYVLTYVALIASVLSILFNLTAQLQVRSLFEESQNGKSRDRLLNLTPASGDGDVLKWQRYGLSKDFDASDLLNLLDFWFVSNYYVKVNSGNEELTWDRMFFSHAQVIFTLLQRVLLIINSFQSQIRLNTF